jgi:hypothetical protein
LNYTTEATPIGEFTSSVIMTTGSQNEITTDYSITTDAEIASTSLLSTATIQGVANTKLNTNSLYDDNNVLFTVKSNVSCFILASISAAFPDIKTHEQTHTGLVVDDRALASLGVSVVCSVLSVDVISCEFVFNLVFATPCIVAVESNDVEAISASVVIE